ncbi:uncharacterized protein LAESUDRAFT_810813 [Laetiporus sulphureus 93-53]|uniref:Cation/H+ exchanger transmembrane domain-containing protein n=1 Tax=Laetiporus sulphureus 93-53 TaxID=1314785 RepID=A0A165FLX7_9APHY|nr:uncharacterized protein LAESUDRAFT_810813 [Laetiporus sulphureus 93-53]KZT09170.1 hypothetical protein LAESUDRAFT_810813 [Laetiporus sulphureus 93-53]
MGQFSNAVIHLAKSSASKREVAGQGGLLNGADPSAFNTSDPLRLWIIQLGVILLMTQILSLFLGKIRQPKVIAEVIGGILLGPTAFGRIPGFTQHIFPADSKPYLSLVANIGLCLFLFLVGLEIDGSIVRRNYRKSTAITLAGIALPFGLGAGLSVPLYRTFISPSVKFTNYMLFTGVAYSITAFPVLCRILTELKLLDTNVGIVVLSAGVNDDVVGWVLLALSVALVNATSGLTALWILLVCVAWALFLLFIMKRIMYWLARRTGSIENGPTVFFMTCTVLLLFGSSFFTDIIGVQAIFGAFLAGLIIPREGGLCIALTEKLEDMVSVIFLPLYFTLSGLNTNLGLLDNGITWGYTIAIISLSFSGKFGGCTLAARCVGFSWRESSTIGSLMSCKGLVELIVLNVGLEAGILSQRVFSMFVLEALVLTFMTTPLVVVLYPPRLREPAGSGSGPLADDHAGKDEPDGKTTHSSSTHGPESGIKDEGVDGEGERKTRFMVILDKIEHLPGVLALTHFIQPPPIDDAHVRENRKSFLPPYSLSNKDQDKQQRPEYRRRGSSDVNIHALRLIELSDRTSDVMRGSTMDTLSNSDSLLNIFSTFGNLNGMSVSSSMDIVPYDNLASSVADHARQHRSQLVIIPWLPAQRSPVLTPQVTDAYGDGSTSGGPVTPRAESAYMSNPFDTFFGGSSSTLSPSALHSQFVRSVFAEARTDVALFIDRGERDMPASNSQQHIFLPFFGGPDDRLALDFVVQLCANPRVTATVVRLVKHEIEELVEVPSIEKPEVAYFGDLRQNELSPATTIALPDTAYGHQSTQTRLQSETADNLMWSRYANRSLTGDDELSRLSEALSRIEFRQESTPKPLRTMVQWESQTTGEANNRRCRPMIVVGRSRRMAVLNHQPEFKQLMDEYGALGSEIRKTVGDVGAALMVAGCKASIVIFQAANVPYD